MPVLRRIVAARVWCALLLVGCRGGGDLCPEPKLIAHPQEIPSGLSQTDLSVTVGAFSGFGTITEMSASTGTIAEPLARQTTYACAYDVSGSVEICVNVKYSEVTGGSAGEAPGVGASYQYLRKPHVLLADPLTCSETHCINVLCPEEKNACPVVSSLVVDPTVLSEGQTATIEVVAGDPDDNPEALVTTLSAREGTIGDAHATTTTYRCDPGVGGAIEICVVASDGDSNCDDERCTSVQCPGDPLDNTCPIIEDVTATPVLVPVGETMTTVSIDAVDPDDLPIALRTEWSAATGVFDDRFASETTFTCGDSGPVEICARANDGDPDCDETSCITVQCPSDIPKNVCPQLFVINGIPRVIPVGQTSTRVETRGQDTDGLPFPLALTLNSLWGSFENTGNIQEPFNVVAQDATYICDRPGPVEICVDATDGACTKTLCDSVICPDDIPTPP